MSNNLNTKVVKTATRWKERAKKDRANRRNITRAQAFALELLEYMELNKLKQTDLASKMEVSPQQVNKILRAKANLTFETLDKIADALGVNITSSKIKSNRRIHSAVLYSPLQVVHKRSKVIVEENLTSETIVKKNFFQKTTIENLEGYLFTADQI